MFYHKNETQKLFTNAINKFLDFENVKETISCATLCTLFKIMCKIQDFDGGHF